MWVAIAKSALSLGVLTFLMWVLTQLLAPVLDLATTGPNADASSVQRIGGYFNALTLDNLVLIAGLAVGVYLLGRAVVERRLTR